MPTKPKTHSKPKGKRHEPVVRLNSTQRGYGYKWQQAREGWLRKHPLCIMCDKATIATEVDHKMPHKGDMALFWDSGNWQSLCKSHHSEKTAREDGGFGR